MVTKKIALLPGDGIGPEVCRQAVKVLDAVAERFGHRFEFASHLVGACAIDATGNPLPDETLAACRAADAVLFGAIGDPRYDNDPTAPVRPEQGLLRMRKELGLFANIRPVTAYPALLKHSPLKADRIEGTDLVIFRELTGGIYFGEKGRTADGTAYDHCTYSRPEIERIAHLAFQAAAGRRGHLTLVDKANVLETSRLWREVVRELATDYPEVTVDYLFVDNAAMQLITNPRQFDVVLTENMFGDILSDEASVIAGSMGLLPSASVGAAVAVFEPIHGSYPQAKGQGIANPLAAILSAAMLLDHLGLTDEAALVREGVDEAISNNILTPELNGSAPYTTEQVGSYVAFWVADSNEQQWNAHNVAVGVSTII
ncbi:3-isopropylmalate dehydrogenase [Hymenobacter baengnokdamensis]|uniref:3-isopropylmalate dehydrogenase n=1 Tax=Hymenobacter baengnokdamensis TaxID=2615203 RepID=UPI0012452B3D|nr:3-isopropylmalate dehydrogenase [Hymenobacter baengnokdamensis]